MCEVGVVGAVWNVCNQLQLQQQYLIERLRRLVIILALHALVTKIHTAINDSAPRLRKAIRMLSFV